MPLQNVHRERKSSHASDRSVPRQGRNTSSYLTHRRGHYLEFSGACLFTPLIPIFLALRASSLPTRHSTRTFPSEAEAY